MGTGLSQELGKKIIPRESLANTSATHGNWRLSAKAPVKALMTIEWVIY